MSKQEGAGVPSVFIKTCKDGCQHIVSNSSIGVEYVPASLLKAEQEKYNKIKEEVSALIETAEEEIEKEIAPYLKNIFDQISCECGYCDLVDENGDAIWSCCGMCSLKDLFPSTGEPTKASL